MKLRLIARLEIEAETQYWLSRPWLTSEQVHGCAPVRQVELFKCCRVYAYSVVALHCFFCFNCFMCITV
uniref:Uncharacterized protein n=1 Tax=Eptatretus burgeri TaxID=7764 RepID=A0A8C4PWU6_EPTBU